MDKKNKMNDLFNLQQDDLVVYDNQLCKVITMCGSFGVDLTNVHTEIFKDVDLFDVTPVELNEVNLKRLGFEYSDLFKRWYLKIFDVHCEYDVEKHHLSIKSKNKWCSDNSCYYLHDMLHGIKFCDYMACYDFVCEFLNR